VINPKKQTSNKSQANSLGTLILSLQHAAKSNRFWRGYLKSFSETDSDSFNVHLAVFVEPYLQFVLEGRKTIESRFSVNRCAPYQRVKSGDVILLKRSGGAIVGLCRVSQAWYYHLETGSLEIIKSKFGKAICAQGSDFWKSRERASFATLIRIQDVAPIESIHFVKRDRRGWVVLREHAKYSE
jgi:ASC-1-like (ASCH) protein